MNTHCVRGFTLIEVMIASVLLAVGLTALLAAASRCLAVMRIAKQYQGAQWALHMGELENPVLPTDDYQDWAVSGETYNDFSYSREVTEPEGDESDGLFVLRSRAQWSDKGRQSYEEVVRLIFVPEEADFL